MFQKKLMFPAAIWLLCLLQWIEPSSVFAQTVSVYEKRVVETIRHVHLFHDQAIRLQHNQNSAVRKRTLYADMAKKLVVPPEYAHIAFPAVDPEREWTRKIHKLARGIKPNMNYQVVKGKEDSLIHGSPEAVKNLHDNVRLIAWYHDELDKKYSSENQDIGARALAALIDEFVDTLEGSIPKVKIRMTGKINRAKDQRLQFSEVQLWNILSVINRYFFYKIQVHSDRKDSLKADFLLMNSMIQTAALFGAQPPKSALRDIDVRLEADARGWKRAAFLALDSWERELNDDHYHSQNYCSISVPPKAQPKPKAPTKPTPPPKKPADGAFPTDVEDVKEVGGQIFIKRAGKWQLWEKKK